MGELSRPIMTPVGVAYRSLHDSVEGALKAAKWGVSLLFIGVGEASELTVVGPGRKGKYEAGVRVTMTAGASCVQPRSKADTAWFATPELAYVLFDALETPVAVYFHKRDVFVKPTTKPPIFGYGQISLDQV